MEREETLQELAMLRQELKMVLAELKEVQQATRQLGEEFNYIPAQACNDIEDARYNSPSKSSSF